MHARLRGRCGPVVSCLDLSGVAENGANQQDTLPLECLLSTDQKLVQKEKAA